MKKILLILTVGLINCSGDKTSSQQTDNEFLKYVSLLPELNLPFEVNCEKCCKHPDINYDNELIKKYKPDGASIVGLISKTSNKVIILVTYPADGVYPSVKVYDLNGNLTGEMSFMGGYCGPDFGYYAKQFFTINTDLSLSTSDTLYYLKTDTVENHVIDTTKFEITRKEFSINDKGQVVENNAR